MIIVNSASLAQHFSTFELNTEKMLLQYIVSVTATEHHTRAQIHLKIFTNMNAPQPTSKRDLL